ncbi:MAG TPA: PilZ domain-containing protein [Myxococcaceae bacterium]|nr:PilZ domain-containing protein [Myxococcaceae bacterium]
MAPSDSLKRLLRVPFRRPVHVALLERQVPQQRLWAENLSSGGMFIRAAEPLEPGVRVSLSLESAVGLVPFAEGEVVWRRAYDENSERTATGFGLRFTSLRPESRALVDVFIKHGGTPVPSPENKPGPVAPRPSDDVTPFVGLPRALRSTPLEEATPVIRPPEGIKNRSDPAN